MEIIKNQEGSKLTLKLGGRLDTTTAPELEEVLHTSLNDITDLVLDFANLRYVSSAGLRVLLNAQKRMNTQGTMKIRSVDANIMDVFEITGFSSFLNIE